MLSRIRAIGTNHASKLFVLSQTDMGQAATVAATPLAEARQAARDTLQGQAQAFVRSYRAARCAEAIATHRGIVRARVLLRAAGDLDAVRELDRAEAQAYRRVALWGAGRVRCTD